MKKNSILLATLVIVSAFRAMDAAPSTGNSNERPEEAEMRKTFRNVTVTAPKLSKAPTIDGIVNAEEWMGAAMAPRLILIRDVEGNDRLTDEEKKIYWGYTDEGLYLAFQFQRPETAFEPVATIKDRDAAFWKKDDAIELHICNIPDRHRDLRFTRDYYFQWNLIGTRFDRAEFPVVNPKWNPDWQIKCRFVPGYGWEGEAFWPFKIFEHAPHPQPGTIWTYNLLENNFSPKPNLTWQAFSTGWSSPRDFANLVFQGPGELFVRVLDVGSIKKKNQAGVQLEIVNPGTTPQKAKAGIKLYKRKPNAASKISYLRALDQSRDRPEDLAGKGKAPLFLPDEKVAESILKENYDLQKEFQEEVSVEPGSRKEVDLLSSPESGSYVVMYEVYQGEDLKTGKILASAALPFVVPEPLTVKVENSILVDHSVQVHAELQYIPDWKGAGTLEAQIFSKEANGKLLFEKKWSEQKFENELSFDVGIEGWKPGEYKLQIVARDPAGKELAKRDVNIQIPEIPEWFIHKDGMEPLIPEPFKPIQISKQGEGQKLDFLMGEYDLTTSVLPNAIKVRSIHEKERKDLLRGPIVLKAKINGKEVVLSGESLKVESAKPELVNLQSTAQEEGLKVSMTGAFEYDGMEKVTMKVAPSGRENPQVEGLWLEIPLKKEYSELAGGIAEGPGKPPWTVPPGGMKLSFREMVWLGDAERRMVWFAENFKGWKLDDKGAKEALELTREADGAVTLRVNLMKTSTPFKLEKEREIVFGLMFTPTKTLYPKPIHIGYISENPAYAERLAKEADMTCAERWRVYTGKGGRLDDLQGWPEVHTQESIEETAQAIEPAHAAGLKVLPYTGWQINRKATVYPIFGSEMVTLPMIDSGCQSDACCWNTPVQDVFTSLLKDRIADSKIDGFRMDAGYVDLYKCSSLKHRGYGSECGWIDDDGNLQGSLPIFAARKAAERGYRLFHGGAYKEGLCIQARTPSKCPPIWSFFDAALCAEGADVHIHTMKELPLEFYRTIQMGDAHGVHMVYMPKSDVTGMDSRLGIALLHNDSPRGHYLTPDSEVSYSRSASAQKASWKLVGRWMKYPENPKTQFWGYWKNSKFVQTNSDDLKASFYLIPGERMLLTVMNFDRKPVEGTVKLSLKDLGFKQAFVQDGITGEQLPLENGVVKLDILPEGYRLLKITTKQPSHGIPQKIGDNLIADSDPSKWPAKGLPAGWTGDASLVKIEDGNLVLAPGANFGRGIALDKNKRYMLEVEARVDCDDNANLGPNILSDRFQVLVQGGGQRWERTIASQLLPGKYETMRLVLNAPIDQAGLSLNFKGKGKPLIRKIGLYAIQPYTQPFDED